MNWITMDQNLLAEYQLLFSTYEGFNDQILVLKGWSATVGVAALLAALSKGGVRAKPVAILVAALTAIPFWLTETYWKLFQNAYLPRLETIEWCLLGAQEAKSTVDECGAIQAVTSWQVKYPGISWKTWRQDLGPFLDAWGGVAFDPHVLLPHVFLVLVGMGLLIGSIVAGRRRQRLRKPTPK